MKVVDTKKAQLANDGVRVNRTGRRTFSAAYKLEVVRRCSEPGVSVAGVAMAHGINANLVRRWIVRQRRDALDVTPKPAAALLPVTIEAPVPVARESGDGQANLAPRRHRSATAGIEIELGGARIHLRGAVNAAALMTVIDVLLRR